MTNQHIVPDGSIRDGACQMIAVQGKMFSINLCFILFYFFFCLGGLNPIFIASRVVAEMDRGLVLPHLPHVDCFPLPRHPVLTHTNKKMELDWKRNKARRDKLRDKYKELQTQAKK